MNLSLIKYGPRTLLLLYRFRKGLIARGVPKSELPAYQQKLTTKLLNVSPYTTQLTPKQRMKLVSVFIEDIIEKA